MCEQLKKAISLAKKSGASVIMFNPEKPQETFVLVDLDSYEKFLNIKKEEPKIITDNKKKNNLTDENLTDKINREISLWKNQDKAEDIDSEEESDKNRWKIPSRLKSQAKEVE